MIVFSVVGVSVLLTLACAWMWIMRPQWQVRGHWPSGTIRTHTDGIRIIRDESLSRLFVDAERDVILYSAPYVTYRRRADRDANPTMMDWAVQDNELWSRPFGVQVLGYSGERFHQRMRGVPVIPWFTHVTIELPWWVLTSASASPFGAIAYVQIRKRGRAERIAHDGACACGYSRAGLKVGVPCPECGSYAAR
ncbi:MAG: hypothetical protein IBJ18_00805 [Phycisphaerales bacterium]|nr:hypothetical protein [Phycisphaerales bacterium]